jgi:hypothetical protein
MPVAAPDRHEVRDVPTEAYDWPETQFDPPREERSSRDRLWGWALGAAALLWTVTWILDTLK